MFKAVIKVVKTYFRFYQHTLIKWWQYFLSVLHSSGAAQKKPKYPQQGLLNDKTFKIEILGKPNLDGIRSKSTGWIFLKMLSFFEL